MSASFHPNRIVVRFAAVLGAVVVALSLVGSQLGLAHSYAGQAERAGATACAPPRLAAAEVQETRAVR